MLAQTAEDLVEAFETYPGRTALEYKLDGARVQIHYRGDQVRIYSRQLSDVTGSLPDVVEQIRTKIHCQEAVLEGEVVAMDAQGRPLPFQDLMRRFRRKHEVVEVLAGIPLQLHLFDALYAMGGPWSMPRTMNAGPHWKRWPAISTWCARIIPATINEARPLQTRLSATVTKG